MGQRQSKRKSNKRKSEKPATVADHSGNTAQQASTSGYTGEINPQQHVQIIRDNLTSLVEKINSKDALLWDKLQEKAVLNKLECKQIKESSPKQREQTSLMLSMLINKPVEDFNLFKQSLVETDQGIIVETLLGEEETKEKSGDLSHWQSSLASHYNRTLDSIPIFPLMDTSGEFKLRKVYTRTDLCYSPGWPPLESHECFTEYGSMFTGEQCGKRILLLGNPGHGKSVLGHIMALNWADIIKPEDKESNGDSEPATEEKTFLELFSLLLFINLSRIRPGSNLLTVLSEQSNLSSQDDIRSLIEYIKLHQKKCFLILDGWDEFHPSSCQELTEIINGHLYPDVYCITTSRIREQTVLPKKIDAQYLVKGFSKEKARLFIYKMLKIYRYAEKPDNDVSSSIDSRELWEIFKVPLLLSFLCTLYLENVALPETITLLFTKITHLTIRKQKLKDLKLKLSSNIDNDPLESHREYLITLGELGLSGLTGDNTKTAFDEQRVMETVSESCLKLGLLQMVKSQDPAGQVLYQFPHKSVQEYISAVYISNSDQGLNTFLNYLDNLIKVHDHQLLVMFISGLNPEIGQRLIHKIQDITESSEATGAQCPGFSWKGWESGKPDESDLAWRHTVTAKEISPFVISCCWELTKSSDSVDATTFPFTPPSAQLGRIQINSTINFKILPLQTVVQLIDLELLSLCSGKKIIFYNLDITQDNKGQVDTLFSHLATNTSNQSVNFDNVVCHVKCNIMYELVKHYHQLLYFGIQNVILCQPDLECVLGHLSTQQSLIKLLIFDVPLEGCEEALCKTLPNLLSLRALYLRGLSLSGRESKMCNGMSHLHKLELLDLTETNLQAAGDALPRCIHNFRKLKYLDLDKTNLTPEQTRQTVLKLKACSELLSLCLANLPVHSAVTKLQKVLPNLTQLLKVDFQHGGFKTEQIVSVISCLPPSVQHVEVDNNETLDDIVSLVKVLPSLPGLRFIQLKLNSVSDQVIHQLKAACEGQGVSLIANIDDEREHGPETSQIIMDIIKQCY